MNTLQRQCGGEGKSFGLIPSELLRRSQLKNRGIRGGNRLTRVAKVIVQV